MRDTAKEHGHGGDRCERASFFLIIFVRLILVEGWTVSPRSTAGIRPDVEIRGRER